MIEFLNIIDDSCIHTKFHDNCGVIFSVDECNTRSLIVCSSMITDYRYFMHIFN